MLPCWKQLDRSLSNTCERAWRIVSYSVLLGVAVLSGVAFSQWAFGSVIHYRRKSRRHPRPKATTLETALRTAGVTSERVYRGLIGNQ
jgi:hypothetical protein